MKLFSNLSRAAPRAPFGMLHFDEKQRAPASRAEILPNHFCLPDSTPWFFECMHILDDSV